MTHEALTEDDMAADTLVGAAAIATYTGKTTRQTEHALEQGWLPAFKLGKNWHMRKSTYRKHVARLEAAAMSEAAA